MSYQERRAIVSVISTILIVPIYSVYMFQRYPDAGDYSMEVFRFWGSFFLILIPVSIVARVLIYIVFSIINTIATNEAEPSITDERDKLIELKAQRNALYVFTLGIFLAMGSLVIEQPPSVMFVIFFVSGVLADVMGEVSQFYFYRRGV